MHIQKIVRTSLYEPITSFLKICKVYNEGTAQMQLQILPDAVFYFQNKLYE